MDNTTQNTPVKPTWCWLLRRPVCFLAFGFGTGLAPKAPGTVGTLPALPLAAAVLSVGLPLWVNVVIAALLFVVGIPICQHAEDELRHPDYGGIVWDEIAAMFLILLFVPPTFVWWVAAFAVFRFFDAVKPWPIRVLDAKIHGGLGIMLDDLLAAVMSLVVLLLLLGFVFP